MKFKKYFISKFIHILSIEETFFFKVKFEKKIKLTNELITLNYKKYAPYQNPLFTTLSEEKKLYIWFYEQKINSKFIIPEAYLLFDFFKEKNPNALLVIECAGMYKIIIIKDNILMSSYTLVDKDESLITMEMNRYSLSSCIRINQEEYLKSKEKALLKLGFNDLYKWTSIKIDNTDLLPKVVNTIAYPLAFLLFFMMAVESYHLSGVEKSLTVVEEQYSEIKNKNNNIREKINYENKKENKWLNFAYSELPYVEPLTMFLNVSKAFNTNKVKFRSFSIVGSRVRIEIETEEDFIVGLNILNKIDGLKNVALKYSNKKRKIVAYEATVMEQGLSL